MLWDTGPFINVSCELGSNSFRVSKSKNTRHEMNLKQKVIKVDECSWMPFTRWVKAELAEVKNLLVLTQQMVRGAGFELNSAPEPAQIPSRASRILVMPCTGLTGS